MSIARDDSIASTSAAVGAQWEAEAAEGRQSLSEKSPKTRKQAVDDDDDKGELLDIESSPTKGGGKGSQIKDNKKHELFQQYQQHAVDKKLIEPYHYINSTPGKDVRGKLIDCFQLWLNVPQLTVLNEIKRIVADLHNASLLIDDIEDNSKLRRGVPVAHSIFGVPSVINTANYVYFLALERCLGLGNDDAMKVRGNCMEMRYLSREKKRAHCNIFKIDIFYFFAGIRS